MIKLKTLVGELLTEEIIRFFPEWNDLQVSVFKEILSLNIFDKRHLINNMGDVGKLIRQYMDENFPTSNYPSDTGEIIYGWDTGNIEFNQIKGELINLIKNKLTPQFSGT